MTRPSLTQFVALVCIGLGLPMLAASQTSTEAEDTQYTASGADTCLACHNTPAVVAIFGTKHGVPTDPRSPFGHGQLQCESCHGPGGSHAGMVLSEGKLSQVIRFSADSTASVETQMIPSVEKRLAACAEASSASTSSP